MTWANYLPNPKPTEVVVAKSGRMFNFQPHRGGFIVAENGEFLGTWKKLKSGELKLDPSAHAFNARQRLLNSIEAYEDRTLERWTI